MFILLLSCCLLSNFEVFSIPISDLNNSVFDQASTIVTASKNLGSSLLQPIQKHRETARPESEGLGSSVLTVYDNSQQNAVNYLNTKPLVDTIQEHEKYGNDGDNFGGINTAIVNGYEAFSNLINRIISTPENLIRKLSKVVNAPLNNIGARLVGLQ